MECLATSLGECTYYLLFIGINGKWHIFGPDFKKLHFTYLDLRTWETAGFCILFSKMFWGRTPRPPSWIRSLPKKQYISGPISRRCWILLRITLNWDIASGDGDGPKNPRAKMSHSFEFLNLDSSVNYLVILHLIHIKAYILWKADNFWYFREGIEVIDISCS